MSIFNYGKWQGMHDGWSTNRILGDEDALLAVKWFPDRLDYITAHAYENAGYYYLALIQDLGMINSIWAKAQMGVTEIVNFWPRTGREIFGTVEGSLESWVKKLHDAVRAIALALRRVFESITGFSIGIGGFPLGFSASISFSLGPFT